MKRIGLDARLALASAFVRQGAVFADVGTDHGYLPLSLIEQGRIERAICSDINPGPLSSAMDNAREMGLADRVEAVLTDGLQGLEDRGLTDIAVCGMGGELIADIIDRAPWTRSKGIRLILQPMSRQDRLRLFLTSEGYRIIEEGYCTAQGKHYVCMLAEYAGSPAELSFEEAVLGLAPRGDGQTDSYINYLRDKLRGAIKARDGRRGEDRLAYESLVSAIRERISSLGGNPDTDGAEEI